MSAYYFCCTLEFNWIFSTSHIKILKWILLSTCSFPHYFLFVRFVPSFCRQIFDNFSSSLSPLVLFYVQTCCPSIESTKSLWTEILFSHLLLGEIIISIRIWISCLRRFHEFIRFDKESFLELIAVMRGISCFCRCTRALGTDWELLVGILPYYYLVWWGWETCTMGRIK